METIYEYTIGEIIELGNTAWANDLKTPTTDFFESDADLQYAYSIADGNKYAQYIMSAILERCENCVCLLTKTDLDSLGIDQGLSPDDVPIVRSLQRRWNRYLVPKMGRLIAMQIIFYNNSLSSIVSDPSKLLAALGVNEADLKSTLERKHRFNDSPENVTDPDSDTYLTSYDKDNSIAVEPSRMTKEDYIRVLDRVFDDELNRLCRDFVKAFAYSPRLEIS